jgi:hypothetical protein
MATATVYDVLDYPGFRDLIDKAKREINVTYASNIRDAARTGNFSLLAQVGANCGSECVETMTIGELLDTKANEHGEQFIDCRAAEGILFGKFGILKPRSGQPRRLALPIQVTWIKGRYDPLPHSPTISGGRHRALDLYILLAAAGLNHEEIRGVKVRITSLVAPSNEDFAMVMEANNMSRKQGTHELDIHKLTGFSVQTHSLEAFMESFPPVASRLGLHSVLFAQLVHLVYNGELEGDSVYLAAKSAWSDLKKADKDNKPVLAKVFKPEGHDTLVALIRRMVDELGRCHEEALRSADLPGDINRIFKENFAREVAAQLEVTAPTYLSQEEVLKQRLERTQAKAESLKSAIKAEA